MESAHNGREQILGEFSLKQNKISKHMIKKENRMSSGPQGRENRAWLQHSMLESTRLRKHKPTKQGWFEWKQKNESENQRPALPLFTCVGGGHGCPFWNKRAPTWGISSQWKRISQSRLVLILYSLSTNIWFPWFPFRKQICWRCPLLSVQLL